MSAVTIHGRTSRTRRRSPLWSALLRWLLLRLRGTADVRRRTVEPVSVEAPDLRAGKAEIDRWVEELHRAGALDEATTDVFERLIDDWARQHRATLDSHRLDRLRYTDELIADAVSDVSRRDLERHRAQREYAVARAALEALRGPTTLTSVGPTAEGPSPAGPPDGGQAFETAGSRSDRDVA